MLVSYRLPAHLSRLQNADVGSHQGKNVDDAYASRVHATCRKTMSEPGAILAPTMKRLLMKHPPEYRFAWRSVRRHHRAQ